MFVCLAAFVCLSSRVFSCVSRSFSSTFSVVILIGWRRPPFFTCEVSLLVSRQHPLAGRFLLLQRRKERKDIFTVRPHSVVIEEKERNKKRKVFFTPCMPPPMSVSLLEFVVGTMTSGDSGPGYPFPLLFFFVFQMFLSSSSPP